MIKKFSTYFRSNESNYQRITSKILTLVIALLTGCLYFSWIPKGILHDFSIVIDVSGFLIKVVIPMFGSDKTDIKQLQAKSVNNCPPEIPVSEMDNAMKTV